MSEIDLTNDLPQNTLQYSIGYLGDNDGNLDVYGTAIGETESHLIEGFVMARFVGELGKPFAVYKSFKGGSADDRVAIGYTMDKPNLLQVLCLLYKASK